MKSIIKRGYQAAVLAVFLSLPSAASASEELAGRWSGSYACGGNVSMTLDLAEGAAEGLLEGTLDFVAPQGAGSYRISGRRASDGAFVLVPLEWIERPAGFDSRALEGRLDPNGTLLVGRVRGCSPGDFRATREVDPDARRAAGEAPPAPLSGGDFAGSWQGVIACSANRRGQTEHYPLTLHLWQDGGGVAGLAEVQIYQQFGSGAGPAFGQVVALSGQQTAGELGLGRALTLDHGGASIELRQIQASLVGPDRIEGAVRMNSCATVAATRIGAPPVPDLPATLSGNWAGTGGTGARTAVTLRAAGDGTLPFLELIASEPASQPEPQRTRLVVTLVAAPLTGETSGVLVPVSYRSASGTGEGVPQARLGPVFEALGFLPSPQPDGSLDLIALTQRQDISSSARLVAQRPERLTFSLVRPSAELAEGIALGETPPEDFGPGIAGLVGTAPTREAQCRALDAWLSPHAQGLDLPRVGISAALVRLIPAFEDAEFVPVFGVPFLFTTQEERRAVALLIRDTCDRGMGLRLVGFVGNRVMWSDQGFMSFNAMVTNRREFLRWREAVLSEVAGLPDARHSLERIAAFERELSGRSRDAAAEEERSIQAVLDRRRMQIHGEIVIAEALALPDEGFETGALNRVFALMRRSANEVTDRDQSRQVAEIAGGKARRIMEEPVARLIETAATTPASLDGLQQLMAERRRLQGPLASMSDHFGYAFHDRLAPVENRLAQLWRDTAIRDEFAAKLGAIEPGPRPGPELQDVAARYFDIGAPWLAPGYGEILEQAIARAEVAAVRLVDLAFNPAPGEPTVQDIARFLIDRTRAFNADIAAREAACLGGQISNPVEALGCLQVPAVMTGRPGFSIALLSVTKYGCMTEIENTRYVCTYSQEFDIDIPGAAAFGVDTLVEWAQGMGSIEAVEARFMRAPDGWTVILGDFR